LVLFFLFFFLYKYELLHFFFFFFSSRRRHTRCYRDWSSDVCSSDLMPAALVTSLVFGGRDLRDLYVVTADNTDDPNRKGTIFRARADVPGLPVPKANF